MIQQCMAKANDPAKGWYDGLALLKKIFANARSISESASQVVRDVASGEAAAGTAIDTYGISEMLWSKKVYGEPRCVYVTPKGGTAVSADPVAMRLGDPGGKGLHRFSAFTGGTAAPLPETGDTRRSRKKRYQPSPHPQGSLHA